MKHTPKPWEVVLNGDGHWGKVEIVGPRLRCVGFTIATDVTPLMAEQTHQDASLIAAALDLKEACKAALDGDKPYSEVRKMLQAAILKAEGGAA